MSRLIRSSTKFKFHVAAGPRSSRLRWPLVRGHLCFSRQPAFLSSGPRVFQPATAPFRLQPLAGTCASAFKDSRDYIGPTWRTQAPSPSSGQWKVNHHNLNYICKVPSATQGNLFLSVTDGHIHCPGEQGTESSWGPRFCLLHLAPTLFKEMWLFFWTDHIMQTSPLNHSHPNILNPFLGTAQLGPADVQRPPLYQAPGQLHWNVTSARHTHTWAQKGPTPGA